MRTEEWVCRQVCVSSSREKTVAYILAYICRKVKPSCHLGHSFYVSHSIVVTIERDARARLGWAANSKERCSIVVFLAENFATFGESVGTIVLRVEKE